MSKSVLVLAMAAISLTVFGCGEPIPDLVDGTWTGTVTSMDDPEDKTAIRYRVVNTADGPDIEVIDVEDTSNPARDVELTADSLNFVFQPTEEDVPVSCNFERMSNGNYEGKCLKPNGDWKFYVMVPPDDDSPAEV